MPKPQGKENKKRTKYVGEIRYANGYFKSGIVKNNKPKKHDVIRITFSLSKENSKTSTFIRSETWDLTLDEAMAVNFLLSKAILFYTFKAPQDVRLWEYQDDKKTLKVAKYAPQKKQ